MVKLRKSNTTHPAGEVVKELIAEKDAKVCTEENFQFYAARLKSKPSAKKMAKSCKKIVPDNPAYKSAKDFMAAMKDKKPRGEVTKILCLETGQCERLWTKEE